MAATMRRVRRAMPTLVAVAWLALPAVAGATTQTASAGGITATLSYTNGPGIETTDERLSIVQAGQVVYDVQPSARGCFKVCSPDGDKGAIHVLDLSGNGEYEVVLDMWTGGADCCGLEQVYRPSAAMTGWVLTERNFGNYGARIERIGPGGRPEFVSGDNAFYCVFNACAASGLPVQIFSFGGGSFHDVTLRYPKRIARDAAFWLKAYYRDPRQGQGVIAAWAADEDRLHDRATVSTVLQRQLADHNLTAAFVSQLKAFLKKHGY